MNGQEKYMLEVERNIIFRITISQNERTNLDLFICNFQYQPMYREFDVIDRDRQIC